MLLVFRKQHVEYQSLMNTWKVKWEDIEPLRSGKGGKDGSTVGIIVGAREPFFQQGVKMKFYHVT